MRIYRREDFLKLPEGTLYCKGKPMYFGGIEVKGETLEHCNDFLTRQLCWFQSENENDQTDKWDAMLDNGASVPLEDAYGRDGCFDDEDVFLVYETADLAELRRILDDADRTNTGPSRPSVERG